MTQFASPSVYAPTGQFRVGAVITQTINLYLRDFGRLSLIACLAYVPLFLIGLLRAGVQPESAAAVGGIAAVLQFILSQIVQSMIIYAAVRSLHGRGWTVSESLGVGFARFWPVLGLAIVAGLTIAAWSLLLVVPGIMAALRLWVVVPVCVVERLGPIASMKRSGDLTRGHRWQLFGLAVLWWLAAVVVLLVVGGILVKLGPAGIGFAVISLLNIALQAVVASVGAVLAGVVYHELRAEKEGANLDDLTRVFD